MGYDHDQMHFERKALIERDRERRRMEDLRITIDNRIARERATFEKLLHEVRSTPTDEVAQEMLRVLCSEMLFFVSQNRIGQTAHSFEGEVKSVMKEFGF